MMPIIKKSLQTVPISSLRALRQSKFVVTIILGLSFAIFIGLILPGKAAAITENSSNIPPGIVAFDRQCDGYKHWQGAWISSANNSANTSISFPAKTGSANLWFNFITAQCDTNIDANGNIINKSIRETRVTTINSSTTYGAISGLDGAVSTLNYDSSHFFNFRWIKEIYPSDVPVHQAFTLSNLSALAPGTYTITVSITARSIHSYQRNWGIQYICVAPALDGSPIFASSLDDPACPTFITDSSITVVVTAPPTIGNVDVVDCNVGIQGWAFDWNSVGANLDIHTYYGGLAGSGAPGIAYSAKAGAPDASGNGPAVDPVTEPNKYQYRYRSDINVAYPGAGNYHGFLIPIPVSYKDGSPHTVYVYAIGAGGGNPLIGTKTFTCIGNVSCSVSYPTVVEPGESFNATFTVFNNTSLPVDRGAGWRLGANGAGRDTNTNNYIAATYNDYVRTDWPTNPIPSGGSASYTVTFQAKVPTTHASDFEHNIGNSFAMTGNNLAASSTPYGFQWEVVKEGTGWTGSKCGSSFTVVNKPYLQVFSGDIISGGQVKAFNRGSSNGYVGSGGQLGVFSSSSVTEFASALLRGGAPVVPKGLTFANKTNEYGGGFAAVGAKTFADYWALSSGKTVQAANYHVAGATLNSKSYYFVNGDAYVDGDILYANTGSWNLSTIPSFYLIANGNIYIKSTVTQLSGVYVANGTIYTCTPFGDKTKLNASDVASKCNNNALTVNGAFLADSVKFLRLANTLSQGAAKENPISGTTKAAETFISGPETWLVSPFTNGNDYNSITSLPPVL
jgi:hypothetical protein